MRAFLADKGVTRRHRPERLELPADRPRTAGGGNGTVELRDGLR